VLTEAAVRLENLASRDRVEETYKLHAAAIWRFCFRLLLDRHAAEDVMERVFVRMAERWNSLESRDDVGLRNWLYGEARNVARSHLREAHKHFEALHEIWRLGHGQYQGNPGPPVEIDPPLVYEAMAEFVEAKLEATGKGFGVDVGGSKSQVYEPELAPAGKLAIAARPSLRFIKKVADSDWHYQGAGIKLGDAASALCWWRDANNSAYQVVYGDLTIKTRDPQDLPSLLVPHKDAPPLP
jgi:DNA-directed RNA polymerase specialized sigma24 family protein